MIVDKEIVDGAGQTHAIKIGLIGFLPPQIMQWDRPYLEGNAAARDILETARAYVPEMKEAGADIIIAPSHSGIGPVAESEMMENASVLLARIDGIDAILTGHDHRVFPSAAYDGVEGVDTAAGTIFGTPAALGGFWGSHLGLVDLMLETSGAEWRVVSHTSEGRPISRRNEDRSITPLVESVPAVLASVQKEHDETLAYVRRAVGKTDAPLHSCFALVADDPSVQIVSIAQKWYIKEMLAGTEYAGLPVLSAATPFKAGGRGGPRYYTDVPVGEERLRSLPLSQHRAGCAGDG